MEEQSNMLPTLLFSVLCDDVRREDNGKFMLIGLFETIGTSKFPASHPALFVVNCWIKGLGTFTQHTRILNPKKEVLVKDNPTQFTLDDLNAKHTVIARFNNVCFQEPGFYSIEVMIENRLMVSYPVLVEQRSGAPR
jgi:hypothetical protein